MRIGSGGSLYFSVKESDMDVAAIQNKGPVVTAPVQAPTPEQTAERRELVKAVKSLNQAELFGQGNELTYAIDRHTQRVVTRIVDKNTGDLIKQIPAEYVLRLAEEFKQNA
jgi:flagellar protein FlaG